MAYSNAIFYINLVSGSDAARSALTGCIAYNSIGATVRINKAAHGLSTGAIVDLTLFDSYLNDAWKITVIDADNFELDNSIWTSTFDDNGTVTPRGGSSWSDGWLTVSNGPTAARTQPGDTIRISKTSDPASLGTAAWTNQSKTVTLSTPAPVQIIDMVDSAFTVANGATSQTTTNRKQGTLAAGVNKASPTATNTLYGYRNLGTTLNLSSYNAITLWHASVFNTTASTWKICLCSDTVGAVIVDSFEIPASNGGTIWQSLVLTRTGGGNLGSSIQSIALYSSTVTPVAGSGPYFDCILACSSSGLNLNSLISKNSLSFGGDEIWYPIQSISGSTILIDNQASTQSTSTRGYYGVSETIASYYRNSFQVPIAATATTTAVNTINEGGTSTNFITYSGGWNTSSNIQDGETIYNGRNGYGYGISLSSISYVFFERISMMRFYTGYNLSSSPRNQFNIPNLIANTLVGFTGATRCISDFNNIVFNGSTGLDVDASNKFTVRNCVANGLYGISVTSGDYNTILSASAVSYNGTYGIYQIGGGQNKLMIGTLSDNGTVAVFNSAGDLYLFDSQLNGTEFAGATAGYDSRVYSNNHDRSGYSWIYTDGGTINSQATTFASGSGAEWRLTINSSTRTSRYPLKLPVAQCAVSSGSLVIINATMKKSHATDVDGRLVIPGGRLLGIPTNVTASLANNTNEQTLQVMCTPIVSGVLEVEAWAEYVNNTGSIFVDEITVSL